MVFFIPVDDLIPFLLFIIVVRHCSKNLYIRVCNMLFHMNYRPLIVYSEFNVETRTRFVPNTENIVIEITL